MARKRKAGKERPCEFGGQAEASLSHTERFHGEGEGAALDSTSGRNCRKLSDPSV